MNDIVRDCLRYVQSQRLQEPLPANVMEYERWLQHRTPPAPADETAEDAWFELDRLAFHDPERAWPLLIELARLCGHDDDCAQIGEGPLRTLLSRHAEQFASRITEERANSPGFRRSYDWLTS